MKHLIVIFLFLGSSTVFADPCTPTTDSGAIFQKVKSILNSNESSDPRTRYEFLIRFHTEQFDAEDFNKVLPGETPIQYRTRLIEMRHNRVAGVIALATANLKSYLAVRTELQVELLPGPKSSPAIVVRTSMYSLKQLLIASDSCQIVKIENVLPNVPM